jgi:hypothetical protein
MSALILYERLDVDSGRISREGSMMSESYKKRLYISRMGVVDCYRNRLSWSFGRVGIA